MGAWLLSLDSNQPSPVNSRPPSPRWLDRNDRPSSRPPSAGVVNDEKDGGEPGSRTRRGDLARITCSPLRSPCRASSRPSLAAPEPKLGEQHKNGAQPRFRARLSAASTQRFHQISLLSDGAEPACRFSECCDGGRF